MGEYKRGCTVQAGARVSWDGKLTPSQCAAFSPVGKGRFDDPDFILGFGIGTFATAYHMDKEHTRVVKFTADKQDALTSAIAAKERLTGTVHIYDVAELKGQRATAPVLVEQDGSPVFKKMPDQPVFAIVSERLGPLSDAQREAANSFWDLFKGQRDDPDSPRNVVRREDPKKIRIAKLIDFKDVAAECEFRTRQPEACARAAEDIEWSVAELLDAGIAPLDLHSNNWGNRTSAKGRETMLILDLGVSAGREAPPEIRQLAGRKQKMQKPRQPKSRARRPKTYDYTLGAFEIPDTKAAGSFASSLLPRALAIGGLGALAYWFFFSKRAVQKKNAKEAAVPTGADTGANVTSGPAASATATEVFTDAGSGTSVIGPASKLRLINGTYTIKAGESWANVAARAFGDYRWWPALWDDNRKSNKFGNPSTLAVGDVIYVRPLRVTKAYKDAIFARAEADRAWELKKKKVGAKKAGARPASTFVLTPPPGSEAAMPATKGPVVVMEPVTTQLVSVPQPADPTVVAAGGPDTTALEPAVDAQDAVVVTAEPTMRM